MHVSNIPPCLAFFRARVWSGVSEDSYTFASAKMFRGKLEASKDETRKHSTVYALV